MLSSGWRGGVDEWDVKGFRVWDECRQVVVMVSRSACLQQREERVGCIKKIPRAEHFPHLFPWLNPRTKNSRGISERLLTSEMRACATSSSSAKTPKTNA